MAVVQADDDTGLLGAFFRHLDEVHSIMLS